MKSIIYLFLCLALTPFTLSAEGKEWNQMSKKEKKAEWESLHAFERQAHQYTRRSRVSARQAKNAQDPYLKERFEKLSNNFKIMADCKREALAAEKKNKKYNWDEYNSVKKQNGSLFQEIKKRREIAGDKAGQKKEGKDVAAHNKKETKSDAMKKEVKTAEAPKEKAKPAPKTFKTADGFMIRTSL